jgi:hypothetical protein
MYAKLPEERRSFGAKNHTTSEQLAALASKAKPGLLIVYHVWISWWPDVAPSKRPVVLTTGELHSTPDVLQREIGSRYSGNFVIGPVFQELRNGRTDKRYDNGSTLSFPPQGIVCVDFLPRGRRVAGC